MEGLAEEAEAVEAEVTTTTTMATEQEKGSISLPHSTQRMWINTILLIQLRRD